MPAVRDYPEAETLEDTDAFIIDRLNVGTMYIEADKLPSGGGSGIAFSVFMNETYTMGPGDLGPYGNGTIMPTMDAIVADTANGLILSFDFAALPVHDVLDDALSPATVYRIPIGGAGIWQIQYQLFITGPNDATSPQRFQFGAFHKDATGAWKYDSGADYDSSSCQAVFIPSDNLNGVTILWSCLYVCDAGDYILPWFQRGYDTDQTDIAGYATFFQGWKVA